MLRSSSIPSTQAIKIITIVGFIVWILLLFFQKTNFAAGDLGRHLMNGKIILESGRVFQNNTYSYTNTNYVAPNHHWLFGVGVYSLQQLGGFPLITLTVTLIYWTGILVMLIFSHRLTNWWYSLGSTFLLLPLFAMRTETRPEAFSVLGLSLTIIVCHWVWDQTRLRSRAVALISAFLIMLFWVNLHILFILGFMVTGCYLIFAFISKSKHNILLFLGLLISQLLAAVINPLGWKTILYPLQIMQNYQYPVAENQSVIFFLRYHSSMHYIYLTVAVVLVALAITLSFKKVPIRLRPIWLIATILLIATIMMNRFSAFFQLPAMVILAISFNLLSKTKRVQQFFSKDWLSQPSKAISVSLIIVIVLVGIASTNLINPFKPTFGFGVLPQIEAAGNFFRLHQLPGPIFNNYDIGGYLIYTLYPTQKVFVDNRPEAYPGIFMTDQYIAGQKDEAVWQQLEHQYGFNTIFFYRHDATDWAMPFLIRRIEDESWVPVYVDDYVLIMVKKSQANQSFIDKLQLPKSMFVIKQTK